MAAANVTLAGGQASQFAASTNVFVATLQLPGGYIINQATVPIWIAEGQTTCVIDGTDQNVVEILNGATPFKLNPNTTKFAFRTDSSTGNIGYRPGPSY